MENSAAVETDEPITLACWAYATDGTENSALLALGSAVDDDLIQIRITSVEYVRAETVANGGLSNSQSTSQFSLNTWFHAAGVFAANNSRIAYLNGEAGPEQTTNRVANDLDTTTIGAYMLEGANGYYLTGRVAEAAVWNVALTAAEIAILAARYSPLFVRPQNLSAYWPLIRDEDQDRVGGYDLTPSGSPTIAAHPPIIYPAPPFVGLAAAGAPPVSAEPKLLAMLGVG